MTTSVTLWFVFPMTFFHVLNQCLIHSKVIFISSSNSHETEIPTDFITDPLIREHDNLSNCG